MLRLFVTNMFAAITASSLLLVSLSAQVAFSQSGDATVQAKEHYQNATAAISKNDWQTAKAELIQAEKLAPQNALVHYDLALAYSHTGQAKSAQLELNKALQLGLPADQKQAAEHLKRQLIDSAAKTTGVESRSPDTAKGNSIADILEWIKDKLQAEGDADLSMASGKSSTYGRHIIRIQNIVGCKLKILKVGDLLQTFSDGTQEHYRMTSEIALDLSTARSDVGVKLSKNPENFKEKNWWIVTVNAQSTFPRVQTDKNGVKSSDAIESADIEFPEAGQDIATRVGKAFSDAIEKCGGKRVKELY